MSFLPVLAAVASVAGPIVQGIGGLKAGKANSRALEGQSAEELRAAQEQERELRKDARARIGAQLAAQWSNGMEGGSGSALDAIRESQLEAILDAREIRRQGIAKATSLQAQAKSERSKGKFALAEGLIGAVSAAGGIKNDWAQARSGTSAGSGGRA